VSTYARTCGTSICTPYGSLDEVPELSAVFVLTLGAGEIDDDIYNELRQELGAFVEAATVELDIDIDDEE